MKPLFLSLALLMCISMVFGQSGTDTSFAAQKQHVDSVVTAIDANKSLTNNTFVGSLLWGDFKANFFFNVESKIVSKMECFFTDATAGKKITYYDKGEPVKIIDNGHDYYFFQNKLYEKDGRLYKADHALDLKSFSKEAYRLMAMLI